MAKYDALIDRLNESAGQAVTLTFDEIDGLVEGGLPPSSYERAEWWANDTVGHVQSKAWLAAGWRSQRLDLEGRTVVFARANPPAPSQGAVIPDTRHTFAAGVEYEMVDADEYHYNVASKLHHRPDCFHGTQTFDVVARDEAIQRWHAQDEHPDWGWCQSCVARRVTADAGPEGVRRDLLTRVIFEILADQVAPLMYRDFLAEVRQRVELSEPELSRNDSNQERYDTFLGFASGWAARIGWIDKRRDGWVLTDLGRAGMEEIGDGDYYREVLNRYNAVYKAEGGALKSGGRRAWLVRGNNVNGKDLVPGWLERGAVSLLATNLREVAPGISRDDLRAVVAEDYSHASYAAQAEKVDEFHNFLSRMVEGHLIVTIDQGQVYAGDVVGEAAYVDDGEPRFERPVDWRAVALSREELPKELRNRLTVPRDVLDLTQQIEQLEKLFVEDEATPVIAEEGPLVLPDATGELADVLHVDRSWLQECIELLRDRPQFIFYGPPGTGKTYIAQALAEHLAGENVRLVQFHPSYSYEDFFEGFRPTSNGGFELKPGPMRRIVDQAVANPREAHVLIIDEINRGNLAKVFGELYFLLEYRDRNVELLYGDGDFSLPANVFIIGTMNTADRSIALVDAAMRRRFAFLPLHPSEEPTSGVLRAWLQKTDRPVRVADLLDELNRQIDDPDFKIGPSYFMREKVFEDGGLERTWRTSILPLLEEHHYGELSGDDVEARYGYATIAAKVDRASVEDDDALPETD